MGCDEINTLELGDNNTPNNYESQENPKKNNLCLKMIEGVLIEDHDFEDCIIKDQEELEDKLRSYIPTKITDKESNKPILNTKDDILTKSTLIDFSKYYLIAINGVNRVLRVDEENGNYLIVHDHQPAKKNKYIALVVTQIGENPSLFYDSPKVIN